jgi:predicted rRNA methylase YqxC with S4 and FtsJ domains
VIKNERIRREILSDLETTIRRQYVILDKADSGVSGEKGNQERFYLVKKLKKS